MTEFKIEKDVPLPARNQTDKMVSLYDALSKLKVGESFALPKSFDPDDKMQYVIVRWGRFQQPRVKFQTRRIKVGEFIRRVWRTE